MRIPADSQDNGNSCRMMGTDSTRALGRVGVAVAVGVGVAVLVGVDVGVAVGVGELVTVAVGEADGVGLGNHQAVPMGKPMEALRFCQPMTTRLRLRSPSHSSAIMLSGLLRRIHSNIYRISISKSTTSASRR